MKFPIILAFLTLPGSAAMLYDEATQGDLPQGAAAPVFQAPVGTHVVSGTVSYTTVLLDIDKFSFVVQPAHTASNLTYSFTNSQLAGNEQISGHVFVYSGTVATGLTPLTNISWIARAQGSIYGSSSPSPVVINTGSLSPGTYTVSVEPNGRSINGGAVPYSMSFGVTAVPEPSSTLLLLFSGVALFTRSRSV